MKIRTLALAAITSFTAFTTMASAQNWRSSSAEEEWIDSIDEVGSGVSIKSLQAAPDASAHPQGNATCASGEIRALDFLVGDWESSTTDLGKDAGVHGVGVNHIQAVLDGCAIFQHRFEKRDGKTLFDSYVIWAFDSAQNRIREFVIDDGLHAQVYEGTWENGGWVFYRDRISEDGKLWMIRVRYTKSEHGFTQTADLTKDRGKTWEKATIASYISAKP